MIDHVFASSLTSGIPGDFPYKRLVKAMIGHAVLESKEKYADFKWLMKSELAELYCEAVGEDITKLRKTAEKIRSSTKHWRRINNKAKQALIDNRKLKVDEATAQEIRDIYEAENISQAALAKIYKVSVFTINTVVNAPDNLKSLVEAE